MINKDYFSRNGYIAVENIYRIDCRNKKAGTAYASRIKAYKKAENPDLFCSSVPCYYIDTKDSIYICDITDIVINPDIIRSACNDEIVLIKL